MILGIDPGPTRSAYAVWLTDEKRAFPCETLANEDFLFKMRRYHPDVIVIEDVSFYGKVLNKETFDTLKLIGRLQEIFPQHVLVDFPTKAYHFCNSRRGVTSGQIAKVIQAKYGGKGTNKLPGPFHGIRAHEWDAVSCAIWYAETCQ
jgi:hypothetical protein